MRPAGRGLVWLPVAGLVAGLGARAMVMNDQARLAAERSAGPGQATVTATATANATPLAPVRLPLLVHGVTRDGLARPPTARTPTATATSAASSTAVPATPTPSPTGLDATGTVVSSATVTPNAVGTPRPFPSTTDRIAVFNDQLAVSGMTEAQLDFAASHYVGTQKVMRREGRRLRERNPGFLVLHYRLGQALGHSVPTGDCQPSSAFLQIVRGDQWVTEWPGDNQVQDRWFFHWQGQRVFQCAFGHYLADLDDNAWRTWWSERVVMELALNDDDGVFADSYSVPNYFGACSWRPCLPVVDATFEADWARKERQFTDYIRTRFAGHWKWIPNLGALVTTRDPSDYGNVDGAMIEGFAEWGRGGWLAEDDWRLQLDRVLTLVRADKVIIAQTYPDPGDVDERLFVLGTYLLVKGDHTYINLDTGLESEWFPEYAIDLGPATAPPPAAIADLWRADWQVYVRAYRNGLVLVNPSTESRAVDLGRDYRRVVPQGGGDVPPDGTPPGRLVEERVRNLTLAPHTAAVLLCEGPCGGP